MAKQKKQAVLDIPVSFNGVSIGDGTANIGVKIDRKHLDIMAADESLCGRRLSGRVIVIQNGDDPKQKMIAADMKHELASTFDTKSFRVSPKYITTGLTFALGEIDIDAPTPMLSRYSRWIGDTLRAALRMEGHAVDWVRDAAAAEATLASEAFDLVLLDLGSAILSAELALEFCDPDVAARVRLSPAPLVEGLVAAVVTAATGAGLWDDEAAEEDDPLDFVLDADPVDPLDPIQIAAARLGIVRLHREQRRVIDAVLSGRDVLMVLPTGFGKSARAGAGRVWL